MDLTLAELQEMASRQQQQIEAQQQVLATKVGLLVRASPATPVFAQSCLRPPVIAVPVTSQEGVCTLSPGATRS